jgi:hypothetical protein
MFEYYIISEDMPRYGSRGIYSILRHGSGMSSEGQKYAGYRGYVHGTALTWDALMEQRSTDQKKLLFAWLGPKWLEYASLKGLPR